MGRYGAGAEPAPQQNLWGRREPGGCGAVKKTPPSLFPLTPCPGEATRTPRVPLCLVDDFFPPPVSVSWDQGPSHLLPLVRRPSGLYSQLAQGEDPARTCVVHHEATGTTERATVLAASPKPPSVDLLHSCSPDREVHLFCFISGFSPAGLEVAWLEDNSVLPTSLDPLKPEATSRGTFWTSTRLNVSMDDWRDKSYSCRVVHPATGSNLEVTGRKCLSAPPDVNSVQVFTLPPSPSDLYVSQKPKLRCLVSNLPSDSGLSLEWSQQGRGQLLADPMELQPQFNGTFSASREVPVATRDWENGETFTCKVQHEDLPAPISRTISRKAGKRSSPRVYASPPSPEELSSSQSSVTLTCLVRGFYPMDISVAWLKDQEPMEVSDYDVGQPVKEKVGDGTFYLYSHLGVPRSEWEQGATYSCMVVHEALPMKFIQRSIRRNPEFLLPQDLCHADPERAGAWDTVAVFVTLFLLSVCYGATVTLFKVRWLLSTVVHLKRSPDYKNVLQGGI